MKETMQQERDPLNLGGLPLIEPPSDGWPAVEAALRQRQNGARRWKMAGAAMAATVALTVGLSLYRTGQPPVPEAAPPQPAVAVAAGQSAVTIESLIGLSQELERNLRAIRAEMGAMPTSSLVYLVELEDLVAQVDDALSMNPDSIDLWSQRVNLLLDLSELYQRELRREYHQMASL